MEDKYMENKFGNLGIGVKIVSDFPHKANDSSILYGVDLDGQKKGGVELVKESPYDTAFYIFRYDGRYGVGYTVETPQTQYEPAEIRYEELDEMYNTWDEAENKLIEMIQNLGEAMEDPDFDYFEKVEELFERPEDDDPQDAAMIATLVGELNKLKEQ